MADQHEIIEAPPVGEEIHLPEPSLLPILNAAGLALAIVGLTISKWMIIVGLLLFFATTVVWIAKARREMDALPLEHHH
jgi:type IV secretory pathway TrbD component